MFNKEFYPTPPLLAIKALSGVNLKRQAKVLDTSAGKGDFFKGLGENRYFKLFGIEIEPELQSILRDKEVTLIGSDLFNTFPDELFDLVILNPPFSNADEHFIKSWEIAKSAPIRAIMPAEMIRNPKTRKQKLLAEILKENEAEISYHQNEFAQAERKTKVEIAIVKAQNKKYKHEFLFEDLESNGSDYNVKFEEADLHDEIARNDKIGNMVIRYKAIIDEIALFTKAYDRFNKRVPTASLLPAIEASRFEADNLIHNVFNHLIKQHKDTSWQSIFKKLGVDHLTTSKVAEDFRKFTSEQRNFPFNEENILALIQHVLDNTENIFKKAILEAFDNLTKYYDENRIHFEGWKTNEAYKCNKKVILPHINVDYCSRGDSIRFHYGWKRNEVQDVEKVLARITGIKSWRSIVDTVEDYKLGTTETIDSTFFKARVYLKGTVHLYWKDLKLLDRFNEEACRGKNWLPPQKEKTKKPKKEKTKEAEVVDVEPTVLLLESPIETPVVETETVEEAEVVETEASQLKIVFEL